MTQNPTTPNQDPPAHSGILQIVNGAYVAGAVSCLAQLGIPDLLENGAKSAEELATQTGAQPDALYRLMRATACVGVLEEGSDKKFSQTPMSAVLRTNAHPSLRGLAIMCAISAVCFFAEHSVKFIATEQRVFSREWMVAGTLDGDILISSCGNPRCACSKFPPFVDRRVVLDLKTSNHIHGTFMAQTAMYQKAKCEEFPECHYDGRLILRLGKEDPEDFEPVFLFGDELYEKHLAFFKRALDLKHSVEETESEMKSVRDERRADEKAKKAAEKEVGHRIRCPKADNYKGSRKTKCFNDGTQCEACSTIYQENTKREADITATTEQNKGLTGVQPPTVIDLCA